MNTNPSMYTVQTASGTNYQSNIWINPNSSIVPNIYTIPGQATSTQPLPNPQPLIGTPLVEFAELEPDPAEVAAAVDDLLALRRKLNA